MSSSPPSVARMPAHKGAAHSPAYDRSLCPYRRLKYAFWGFNAKAMFRSFCDEIRDRYGIECVFDDADSGCEIPGILARQLLNKEGTTNFLKRYIVDVIHEKLRAENHRVDGSLIFLHESESPEVDGKHELVMLHLVHTIRNCLKLYRKKTRQNQKHARIASYGTCLPHELAGIENVKDVKDIKDVKDFEDHPRKNQDKHEFFNAMEANTSAQADEPQVGQKRKHEEDDKINEQKPKFIDSSEEDEIEACEQYYDCGDKSNQAYYDADRIFTLPEMRNFFALDEKDLNMYDFCSVSLTRDMSGDAGDASTGVVFDTFCVQE